MRFLLSLLLILVTALPAAASARVVRVGIYDNPPKIFMSETGQASGILVDLLASVASNSGWELEYVACQWEECLEALRQGNIDLMPDVAYSGQRALDFDFHQQPALISWSQLYRHKNVNVLNYLDLQDRRIAVLKGSIQESFLTELLSSFGVRYQIVHANSLQEVFIKVAQGKADVGVSNHLFGEFHAHRQGVLETPVIFNPARLYYATAKGKNADLLARLDQQLIAWQADANSEYYKILHQWRGPKLLKHVPGWLWAALGLLIGSVVLVAGGNLWLRREVQRKVASLEVSEARFRSVFDSVSEAIFIHERHTGRVLQVNQRMCEMYGCTEAEALQGSAKIFSLDTPPYDEQHAMQWLAKAINEGPQVFEWQARRQDNGAYFWIEVSLRAVTLGSEQCILAVVRDISERKAADLELAQYREHLEDMVEQRTAELQRTQAEAERLAKTKSEFLANMSHEIRTPLMGVIGFAQIGHQRLPSAEASPLFKRIMESGQLLQRIIDDILDFSKIEAGKLTIEAAPFNPRTTVENAIALVRQRAELKNLPLLCEISSNLPHYCQGDALRIEQILLNLLSNAIKFTAKGNVRISAKHDGRWLQLSVADTGIGLSPDMQKRLFQAFEQEDSSTTRRFGGTGLGLAITRRLVDMMGGRIEVISAPEQGSTFTVLLPCPRVLEAGDQTSPDQDAEISLTGLSVLVAEDNEINQEVLSILLSEEGIVVDLAENGQVALDKVMQRGPEAYDLVLMDVMMPVMDGHEATRQLQKIAPELPVIGQTAHALEEERQACLAAGMRDRLTKPVDPDELFAMIRRHARRRSRLDT